MDIPKHEYTDYQWEKHQDLLDKLIYLNHEMLKTPFEIERETGVSAVDLKLLFEHNNVRVLMLSDIAFRKRDRDFERIYDLHIKKKISLNEIYRKYGFSPLYSRRVLKDKGVDHLGFVNQLK